MRNKRKNSNKRSNKSGSENKTNRVVNKDNYDSLSPKSKEDNSEIEEIVRPDASENFKATFLQKRELKTRMCVYISLDVHETVIKIVNHIADNNVSVGVYVDTVLKKHFEANKQEINALYQKKKDDLIK